MKRGDRVRLRDGVLPWIGKRDGWPIPPEPERVAGQAWRDAAGRTVMDTGTPASNHYIVAGPPSRGFRYCYWLDLAHPLTPLYPLPDPDDDEAVESLRQRTNLAYHNGTKYWPDVPTVRAVLRALRGDS